MADYNNHFELTLDTLAPEGKIHPCDDDPELIIKANQDLTIEKGDASWMYVWRSANATETEIPAGVTAETAATAKATDFLTSTQEYYHLVLEDNVGNKSGVKNTKMITFDNVPPTISNAYLEDTDSGSKDYTNARVVNYHFEVADNLSGCVSAKIEAVDGSIAATITPTIVSGVCSGTLELLGEDGLKQVSMTVTDAAGNVSVAATPSIYLDLSLDAPVVTLMKDDSEGTALPASINFHNIKARLVSSETDIVAYRIWEGDGDTAEAGRGQWITQTAGSVDYVKAITLSANDGTKQVTGEIKDRAGSTKISNVASVLIDTVAPVPTISRTGAEWISNVTGFTTSTIHIKVEDASAGVKAWTLKCNGSTVETGNAAVDKDVTITSAITGMTEGANNFTLEAVDLAENTASAGPAVVNLDTTAPTPVSITQLNTWYNAQFSITANTSDGAGVGVATIYAWTSMTAADTSCPAAAKAIARTADAQVIQAADITWALEQSAANYMHIKVVDAVGNVNYAHCQFGYDNVIPYDNGSKFHLDYYNVVAAQVDLAYGDATSLVSHFKVTGADIDNPSTDWEAIAATRAVTLNGNDGVKTVSVQFKDNAGNISDAVSISTELDRSKPSAMINLHVAGEDTAKPSVSNIATFDAWIAFTDDTLKPETFKYLYYGTGIGVEEGAAEWKDFTPTSGKFISGNAAMVLPTSTCTSGDGLKTVYVKFKDGAGNVSDAASASFTYDTTAPEPEAKNVDYYRISKVHVTRKDGAGAGTKYADEVCFVLDPHCTMQAYKVCAYADQTAAKAGSHADAAIPTTAGSINMSGTGLKTSATVDCKIKGTDFETALPESSEGKDGAHIVVVYVQDEGGNWSVAASFNV